MEPNARLYAILARSSPVGLIFRRGPSKRVLLIRWNTEDDTFEVGQCLKGRIYERRCDLSPEGDLLLYFAASWKQPYFSWSAVSRPPYLTALALWPKGDGWGGGGHFVSRTHIALNHRQSEMGLAAGFSLPDWLEIEPFGDRPGSGEDDPVWTQRLQRDGWVLVSEGKQVKEDHGGKVWIEFDPPITFRRAHPQMPNQYVLKMSITGLKEKDGPWYLTEHSIVGPEGAESIGRSDWADWSQSGDLLFAKGGRLFRLRSHGSALRPPASAIQVVDFSNLKFEERESPNEARFWP